MARTHSDDDVDRFVLELLRTGWMLSKLVCDLAESLPDDAYPGEEPTAVVIEMVAGSIRSAIGSDPRLVRQATALIDQAVSRTIEHLQLALKLSKRTQGSAR
jgi:hypothetical protein